MNLENQVVSLKLAQKMKELGFKQESLFYWKASWHDGDDRFYYNLVYSEDTDFLESADFRAYTVAELGEMLPFEIDVNFEIDGIYREFYIGYDSSDGQKFFEIHYKGKNKDQLKFICVKDKTEADARAKMLIYLRENNLI